MSSSQSDLLLLLADAEAALQSLLKQKFEQIFQIVRSSDLGFNVASQNAIQGGIEGCQMPRVETNEIKVTNYFEETQTLIDRNFVALNQKELKDMCGLKAPKKVIRLSLDGQLICPYNACEEKFLFKQYLKEHMNEHLNTKQMNSYSPIDNEEPNKNDLKVIPQPQSIDNQITKAECLALSDVICKVKCDMCGKELVDADGLVRHKKRKHSNAKNKRCEKCEYTAHTKKEIRVHINSNHDGRRYVCEECGRDFASQLGVKNHRDNKHSDKLQICDQCDYQFKGPPSVLASHVTTNHEAIKYPCKFCSFKADSVIEVEDHVQKLHSEDLVKQQPKSGEKIRKDRESKMDYTCKLCGYKMNKRATLGQHMNVKHHNIKYNCTEKECDYKSSTKFVLRRHIETKHYGLRLYCDLCDFTATLKSVIKRHKIKVHALLPEMFKCDKCNMRCSNGERMRKHMLSMH